LADIVLNAKWSPGDRLASEHQLCQIHGVSRSVVRQALAELAKKGLIHKVKGQGVFFTGKKIDSAFVQQAAGFCEEMIAKGHQIKTRVLKLEIEPANVQVARQLGIRVNEEVVCLDRLRFVDGETFLVVCTFLPVQLCPGLEKIDMADRSLYQVLREKYNLGPPAGGERTVEAVPTPGREAALLNVPRGSPALLSKRPHESAAEKPSNIPLVSTEVIRQPWISVWCELKSGAFANFKSQFVFRAIN